MTTTPVERSAAPASPRAHVVPDGSTLGAALRAEWTKLRSVRSTLWAMLLTIAFAVGIGALLCWSYVNRPQRRRFDNGILDPTHRSLGGVVLAMLAIGVLGVLVMSSEHTTGMVRTSLAAVPRRRILLLAKYIVLTAVSVVVSGIAVFVAFAIGQAIFTKDHVGAGIGDPGVLRAVLGAGAFLVMVALLGLAIGTVVRRTPGALATLFGIVLILPLIARSLPAPWDDDWGKFLPLNAGQSMFTVTDFEGLASPLHGLLVLLVWVAVAMVAAFAAVTLRDP